MTNYINIEDIAISGTYTLTLHIADSAPSRVELISISGVEYLFKDLNDESHYIGTSALSYYDIWVCTE